MKYRKIKKVYVKDVPELSEKWVQDRIDEDPTMLGLGDLIVKDRERIQPRAGRLDMLLQDADTNRRYEVEIQLGKTDESHIIRTIEYWDIERKRYPQYDHTAVLIGEDVTSRFLNVIGLFNGAIPLIAIQMSVVKFDDEVSLMFTTVLDQTALGFGNEEEEERESTDRPYWEKRATPATLKMADEVFALTKEIDPDLDLKYNKFYIGLAKNGQPNNFVILRPKKSTLNLAVKLKRSEEMQQKLDEAGLDLMDYDDRYGRYRVRLKPGSIKKFVELLRELLSESYREMND